MMKIANVVLYNKKIRFYSSRDASASEVKVQQIKSTVLLISVFEIINTNK